MVRKFLNLWLPPLAWALVIFVFSAISVPETSQIYWRDFIVKKLAHIIEYGIFAILLYRAFKENGVERKNAGLYAILISLIYGATDEIHQSFTPGREPKVRDVIFDTAGAIIAIYSVWNLLPKAPEKLQIWAKKLRIG